MASPSSVFCVHNMSSCLFNLSITSHYKQIECQRVTPLRSLFISVKSFNSTHINLMFWITDGLVIKGGLMVVVCVFFQRRSAPWWSPRPFQRMEVCSAAPRPTRTAPSTARLSSASLQVRPTRTEREGQHVVTVSGHRQGAGTECRSQQTSQLAQATFHEWPPSLYIWFHYSY